MKSRRNMYKKAFTLVELLVVISIIGILATLVFVSFTSAQKASRDAKRKSDIKNYQSALETYANKFNGFYPSRTTVTVVSTVICTDLGLTNCPEDPRAAQTGGVPYRYISNGTGAGTANATDFILFAQLESKSFNFITCSNGKTGELATSVSITNATCPL